MSLSLNYPDQWPTLLLDFANAKRLDPRITFARATTATYYDGVTETVSTQNLLTWSEQLDNIAWAKAFATITANTTVAPDGTTTADSIFEFTSTTYHGALQVPILAVNQTYCISAYVKKNTRKYAAIGLNFSVDAGAVVQVDLDAGTIAFSGAQGTGYSVVSSAIASVGNGWYRVSAVMTNGTSAGVFTIASGGSTLWTSNTFQGNAFAGSVTEGIYAWGMQVEQGAALTAYTPTTTLPVTTYVPVLLTAAAGQPRFDHNPVTDESLGLRIEQARTNLILNSGNVFAWSIASSSLEPARAPDGSLTAARWIEGTGLIRPDLSSGITVTVSETYAVSFYAKSYSPNRYVSVFGMLLAGANECPIFDLTNGTVSVSGGTTYLKSWSMTAVGDGWYRCAFTAVAGNTSGPVLALIDNLTSWAAQTYTANGWSGVYVWGFQCEIGAYATSYIPTTATAQTRNTDDVAMTGTNFTSWFNNAQGTLYVEQAYSGQLIASPAGRDLICLDNNVFSSGIFIRTVTDLVTPQQDLFVLNLGVNQVDTAGVAIVTNTFYRTAIGYQVNNYNSFINGASGGSDITASVPVISQFRIAFYDGWVKKIAYYDVRVTDTQLLSLTRG
jgi:hypothetical protein